MPRGNFLAALLGGLAEGGSQGLQDIMALRRALVAAGQLGLTESPIYKAKKRIPTGSAGEIAPAPEYVGQKYQRYREGGELESMYGLPEGYERIGETDMWGMPTGRKEMRFAPTGIGQLETLSKQLDVQKALSEPDRWAAEMAEKETKVKAVDALGNPLPDEEYNRIFTAAYSKYRGLAGVLAATGGKEETIGGLEKTTTFRPEVEEALTELENIPESERDFVLETIMQTDPVLGAEIKAAYRAKRQFPAPSEPIETPASNFGIGRMAPLSLGAIGQPLQLLQNLEPLLRRRRLGW